MVPVIVAFGSLIASGHAAPHHVDVARTASEVEAVKSKLHEKVLRAEADIHEKVDPVVPAGAWKKAASTDGAMDAAHYTGKHDWAWNGAKLSSATPAMGHKDAKDHATTSADVDAYQNRLHHAVVHADTSIPTSATKWKVPEGGRRAAAHVSNEDWAWGGGASALQAGNAALRGSALKSISAKSLAASGVPDPLCKTGVISLVTANKPQSCCAGYCGECSDYATCKNVRGQDSENACCASKVYDMRCGKAAANVCLKKCSEAVPPCIMDKDEIVIKTPNRNAADNCTKAVPDWRAKAENAIAAGNAK